jgi:FkbM family methyltransferase
MLPPAGSMSIDIEGRPIRLVTNQTSYLTQLLYWKRPENFEYTSIFLDVIRKVDTFFDVGANIGYYSLLAAHVNPTIKVTAFEPARGPLHFLRRNIELNGFNQIRVEPVALSDSNGMITFYESGSLKYAYVDYNLAGDGNTGSIVSDRFVANEVAAIRPDDYVAENHVDSIDLIKIDTEGTEHLILRNADRILSKMRPIIVCETLFDTIEDELDELLSSYGYEFFNHTERGLQKTDTIRREEDNQVRNCFFVHPDKRDLIADHIV